MSTHLLPTNSFKNASTEEMLGIIGILILSLSAWKSTAGAHFGLAILLYASIALLHNATYRRCWLEPSTLISLVLAGYILTWDLTLKMGEIADAPSSAVTKEWLFILLPWCSYWFYRFPKLIPICLFLIAISLLIESIDTFKNQWHLLTQLWQTNHRLFSGRGYGLYFALAALALLALLPRFWAVIKTHPLRWPAVTLYLICALWFTQCLLLSQARAAWASFTLGLVILVSVYLVKVFSHKPGHHKGFRITAVVVVITLTIAGIIYANEEKISARMNHSDIETLAKIIEGENDFKLDSASYRYLANVAGIEIWLHSPLVGLGPTDSKTLIRQLEYRELRILAHFHNTYLEILVQLGLIGLLLCLTGVGLAYFYTFKSYRNGLLAEEYFHSFTCSLVIISLYSLTDYRLLNADWRFFWIIAMGMLQAQAINYRFTVKLNKPISTANGKTPQPDLKL